MKRRSADTFDVVRTVGLSLPDVEAGTKYDGSPVLKRGGSFMAGLATHPSAEPDTLVVRADFEEREWLLQEAPETYYLTDYYRNYPLVLVRLSSIEPDALRDLLSGSWRLTAAKSRKRRSAALKGCATGHFTSRYPMIGSLLFAQPEHVERLSRVRLQDVRADDRRHVPRASSTNAGRHSDVLMSAGGE